MSDDALAPYLVDEAGNRGSAERLVRTGDLAEIAALLRQASAVGVPVTFSARRTSLTGSALPDGGWLVVLPEDSSPDLVVVDGAEATAPARVLVSDVEAAADAAGRFFGPDPTSRKTCSIGGAVACNASGARSFRYGPTGAWVEGLTVCLASGEILRLRRGEHPPIDGAFHLQTAAGPLVIPCPPAHPAGLKDSLGYATQRERPDVIDLFVGSEGTLGYLHDVTLRLLPRREIFAALVFWDAVGPALDFVQQLQTAPPAGLAPMSVEWFDRASLELAAARHPRLGVPASAAAALFVEQRHDKGDEDAVAMAWYEALLAAGAPDDDRALRIARNKRDLEAFREFRHAVPESINALARGRGLRKLGTDLAWPPGTLHQMVAYYDAAVADVHQALGADGVAAFTAAHGHPPASRLDAAAFGHIGDNHVHLNLLPRDAAEAAAGKALYHAMSLHCAALGGAISGEHGVGKSKRDVLAEVLPPARLAQMRAIKAALDPAGVLGRGNLFSWPG
ncbi:MAG: FAD-binding oxidoreductase [Myxococcales bacterium]|nr:FAD-binding oxidoreductase [Myxococcales bacterium]MCB9546436.1 FAD-binding oxidoreductase [Myxococcales bacterium]